MSTVKMVSIAGVDESVDPKVLVQVSKAFPFVEWGVLLSHSRMGTPRYTSMKWIESLLLSAVFVGHIPKLSLHLCGDVSRKTQSGDLSSVLPLVAPQRPHGFQRVQINGLLDDVRLDALAVDDTLDLEFILQAKSAEHLQQIAKEVIDRNERGDNMSLLLDASGGRGVPVDMATVEDQVGSIDRSVKIGLAGGIGPDNIDKALEVADLASMTWVDMESGVRTADRFDLAKALTVLRKANNWFELDDRARQF